MSEGMGLSGRIAKQFLRTEITPLLAILGLLLGLFAVLVTPREEEPQISVTFANVFIPFPGATAKEVEQLVTTSAEQVLAEIEGVKHIYSVSRPGMSVLTIQFKVGEPRTAAIVRLYNAIYSNRDWLPPNIGVGQPLIKPQGIDDVPIVTGTLWTDDEAIGTHELLRVAHAIEAELKRVPGTRDIYTIGGPDSAVNVVLDPQRMAAYNIALPDLRSALQAANVAGDVGQLVENNAAITIRAGEFLSRAEDVAQLVVAMYEGAPVYLEDVAEVSLGPDRPEQYVWFGTGAAAGSKGISRQGRFPAVTLAIAKQPGTNAVEIAEQVIKRFEQLKGTIVPEGIQGTLTRNYGETANDKAKTLIGKLMFATGFVVLLVLVALGWREAFIVGTAVVITLAVTLFASWAWGFTLNRVSLFALIFSIGILVDDAIVVVENIHRHMGKGGLSLAESIPLAVDEVGGPTILATFTVIAALLPMAFVTGLMGPYMSPIPINASIGMLISLAVAFVITPWMTFKVLQHVKPAHAAADNDGRLYQFFNRYVGPYLNGQDGAPRRRRLWVIILIMIVLSISLVGFKLVVLKMLPFDNKSEFQVVVDMPEGTTLQQTARVIDELGSYLAQVPEVSDYQAYVGTAAPINFNGLVRQYYLRKGDNVADIQVNLVDKKHRDRKSHEIALAMRVPLQAIGAGLNANVKVVEVPPGPPVFSPLVAEVYGIDYAGQIQAAKKIRRVFEQTDDVVDVDDSIEADAGQWLLRVDRQRAARLGVSQQQIVTAIQTVLEGEDASYLHVETAKYPVPIRLEFADSDKTDISSLLALKLRSHSGALVSLGDVVSISAAEREHAIYHKDLLPVVYVTADMAGDLDSPLYGMFDIFGKLNEQGLQQYLIQQPEHPFDFSLKWDGEWQITYETFRDMGIAYAVGMILIYLLVVAQFRSYMVPLIIMAPIPLTIIGVMPGHALFGAQFTATSMIGMIALAGIIVRNSILLVDFINETVRQGVPLQEAVIRAGAVRSKPIALTALAAMLGAVFILDDPIFSGLAISLIFGILVSTLLTLVVIPVLYYAYMYRRMKV
ncbi:efflux RND transporter permease subunit [Sulfuriflexus mobilis]|uniref:efflux RND transporter permease subunit n=1 Tax=Sulfuriflexus mobilis TaxID=1811807 RepID=UPI000F82124F|nr:efflux RND transporter permease subunit [Sulfuriflexus mobilis]